MKRFYLVLAVVGFALPYAFLSSWLLENGVDIALMVSEVFSSKLSMFAWADVVISAIVLIWFIRIEGNRQNMANVWVPIFGTCVVGVSFGLPLFLYMRERNREHT